MEAQYANRQEKQSKLTTFSTSLSSKLLNSDASEPNTSQVDENYTTWLINPFIVGILNKVYTIDIT